MTCFVLRTDSTFTRVLRAMVLPYIYKPIQSITQAAPAVVGCIGHGAPNGWPVAIVSVPGMTQINTKVDNGTPRLSAFLKATARDVDTLELNTVNSAGFDAYTPPGGYVQYYTPIDLTSAHSALTIKDKKGGTTLVTLTDVTGEIVLDNTAKTITATLPPATVAGYTWTSGYFDWVLTKSTGEVVPLLEGDVTIEVD